ncbi:limbic system-associated membrane protein-like [Acropora millepora]|uniref:limbic system-associated membrane protein-like n=1 Tax=Acropora millepora TaxID=45264 RepID=UPI001CF3D41B|nr:limbic system-associated membrane protein-like [Acropora millepora]
MADSTSGSWNAAAFLFTIFLCSPETETANITVIRPKSLSTGTLYAVEGKNLTLEWFYTILGTVGASKFAIVNADGSEQVIGKGFSPGAMNVTPRYQERFKVEATDTRAELTILAVQRSDEKRYELNILPTGDGSILENWVVMVVNVPPNITEISENQTVIEGGNVTLKCVADGKPTPNITWTIFSDNSVVNMTLTDIRRQDAGKYNCTADNGIGSAAFGDVWIVVQYPVEAKEFGVNKTVGQGRKTTLSCPVDGIPKPNITWYRGNDANGSPIFIGVKLEAREAGCYTCVASNSLGIPVSITQCLTVGKPFF